MLGLVNSSAILVGWLFRLEDMPAKKFNYSKNVNKRMILSFSIFVTFKSMHVNLNVKLRLETTLAMKTQKNQHCQFFMHAINLNQIAKNLDFKKNLLGTPQLDTPASWSTIWSSACHVQLGRF